MRVNEVINTYSRNMPLEKKEIFDAVAVLFKNILGDNEDFFKKYQEALVHYKNKEYNLFEKSIDSFLGVFKLTTAPKDSDKMQRDGFASKNKGKIPVNMQLADLDKSIQKILDEKENLQKQLDLEKNETNRLKKEVNEVNVKLSSSIRLQEEDEEKRKIYFQKMIAELGDEGTVKESSALALMMEDYDYSYSWDIGNNPEWFNSYIVSDSSRTGVKMPAILKGEKLSQKGLAYVLDNHSDLQNTQAQDTTE